MDTEFNDLPNNVINKILVFLSCDDIINILFINKRINTLLNANAFWNNKYKHDFEMITSPPTNPDNWRKYYLDIYFNTVWISGTLRNELSNLNYKSTLEHINISSKYVACGPSRFLTINMNDTITIVEFLKNGNITYTLLNTEKKVKQIACGSKHFMFIDSSDDVWVCGNNELGQLGIGNYVEPIEPIKIPQIKGKHITCGINSSFIIDTNDKLWACGSNTFGQLGISNNYSLVNKFMKVGIKVKDISSGHYHSVAINMNNEIMCTGNNNFRQLCSDSVHNVKKFTKFQTKQRFSKVRCGAYYTLALDDEDNLWGFGQNNYGQLGKQQKHHSSLMYITENIKDMACGVFHSIYITNDGKVYGLGKKTSFQSNINDDNSFGQVLANNVFCGPFYTILLGRNYQ